MLRLNQQQRTDLGATLRELANMVLSAFVLAQFLTGQPLSWLLFVCGLLFWAALVGYALVLSGES